MRTMRNLEPYNRSKAKASTLQAIAEEQARLNDLQRASELEELEELEYWESKFEYENWKKQEEKELEDDPVLDYDFYGYYDGDFGYDSYDDLDGDCDGCLEDYLDDYLDGLDGDCGDDLDADYETIVDEIDQLVAEPDEVAAIQYHQLERKAIAINRHLSEIKAQRRASSAAKILTRKYRKLEPIVHSEDVRRMYLRVQAAQKKVARVK